jgi:diguanylate cyclase (GGDEF)-like protein/PAS domain S-box-containing protein
VDPHTTEALNATIDCLFELDPPVRVVALAETGLCVPMPPAVPLRGHLVSVRRISALELVCPDDVVPVIHAWDEAGRRGAASVTVHLLEAPGTEVALHFVDARHRWGVFLRFLVGAVQPTATSDTSSDLLRPRVGVIIKDQVANVISCDDALTRMLGWAERDITGMRSLDLVHPDDHAAAIAIWMDMLSNAGASRRVRLRHLRADGGWHWVEVTNENLIDHPDHGHVRAEVVDISEEMAATEALRTGELLLRQLTDALPVGIAQLDDTGTVIFRNDRLAAVLGRTIRTAEDLLGCVTDQTELTAALAAVRSGADLDLEVDVLTEEGGRHLAVTVRGLVSDTGAATGVLLCLSDVTEATLLREQLAQQARIDGLTGCFRRSAAIDHIDWLLTSPDRPAGSVTVLFVDLDGFKGVNDRHGHAAGDTLLREVGRRLRQDAGPRDVVGRLGGDEFVVVMPDLASAEDAEDAGMRLTELLLTPVEVGGHMVVPHASVGTAWTTKHVDADTLVAHADAQMYRAKRSRPDRRRPVSDAG